MDGYSPTRSAAASSSRDQPLRTSSSSSAAAMSPSRSSPFAYQQKLLERSGSKPAALAGSGATGHGGSGSSTVGGGMSSSTSLRKYPMPGGHRHTSSFDPSKFAAGATGGMGNSSASRHALSDGPASASAPRSGLSGSPPKSSYRSGMSSAAAPSTPPSALGNAASSRVNRHYSMPPAPREADTYSSSSSQPPSPVKLGSVFPGAPRPLSPTKMYYDRPPSPHKSPGKDDASWIKNGVGGISSAPADGGSFWSHSATGSPAQAPAAVHLGGVGDLKRSSVGALKMMRNFTAKSDPASPSSGGDAGTTRMTVGRARAESSHKPAVSPSLGLDSVAEDQRPVRPGRIESEDQEGGEIYIPGITTGAEDVSGLHGRIRLARQDTAGPGTIAMGKSSSSAGGPVVATSSMASSLPFSANSKWMDTQRHLLQAYEYLCHCGEAKQWMEACLVDAHDEAALTEGGGVGDVVDMENQMRNGVTLAKIARHFEPELVPRIFTHPKLQYRHTDNVNYFFKFVHWVGLPVFFHFELTDLYEKKNFPKVIYCIHALSHILARQGRSVKVNNLIGKLEFTDDQLQQTQRGLDAAGVAIPSFGGLGKALAKEMNIEPEPEPEPEETEQERIDRELQENAASVVSLQAACRAALARDEFQIRREDARRAEAERQRAIEEQQQRRRLLEEEEAARLAAAAERQRRLDAFAPRLQSAVRGALVRRRFYSRFAALEAYDSEIVELQARARGMLGRRAHQRLLSRLAEATPDIIKAQTAARALLAKRALLTKIRSMRSVDGEIVLVQAQIRGVLARRKQRALGSALQRAEVTRSVGGVQSLARAVLARRKHQEQQKQLSYVSEDVTALQAQIRGMMVRQEYEWWRNHIHENEPVAVYLQSLVRGMLARRAFRNKMRHYHEHMDKVVKIQSLFRGRQQGEQYRSLTMGKNVPVSTIKNFGHLLNDSDHDFEDEIEVERLRKLVVRSIRENQTLENDVTELDGKIALLVKNKIGIEELIKAKNERGLLRPREANAATSSVLAAAGDPFADETLDKAARAKLELYQELFYSLQTRPEYLARLFARVGKLDMADRQRKQVEKIVLTLFGYAQKAREEFLLLKLFQRCVPEELVLVNSVQDFMRGNPQFFKLVVQYNRGAKERQYLCDVLSPLVRSIIDDEGLDLETDPCAIYRGTINQEEMETGRASARPLEVDFQEALADPMARTIFIRHLQALRASTEAFLSHITASTRRMPFGVRYIGREVFRALQARFPHESEDSLIKIVGHLVYYRYLNPAVVAPESFDVIENVIGPVQRKNLAEVSKMLTQISNGRLFSDDNPYLQPLNEYVTQASARFIQWLYAVIDVPDAEEHFHADEFLDHAAVQAQRPVIYISPNEIYSMHLLVSQQLSAIAPDMEDPLRVTLEELGAPPVSSTQELSDARLGEITFELVSRRTSLRDPEADTKALFVETKRLVLSLLKVQSGKTLVDVFLTPITDQDEATWQEIVALESQQLAASQQHQQQRRHAPRLEDVRLMSLTELKARTMENILQLEKAGKVTRASGYTEMLNSIASDIRQKHRKRVQRANEKSSMLSTLDNLAQKKRYLEEQIASYHSYVDASMQTMQKKGTKKRFVVPFSQQYFHLRELKQQGKVPQFGSYKYPAARLHEKGVLLSIDDFGERAGQFDQLTLTISSDQPGVFTIDALLLGVKAGSTDLRIEELLELQANNSDNVQEIAIGGAKARLNLNLLIHLINRKFYA